MTRVLERKAARAGMRVDDCLKRAIEKNTSNYPKRKKTGADIVKYLQNEEILGTFSDKPDSPVWAAELRSKAEKRDLK